MNTILEYPEIRKGIAVYVLKPWLEKEKRGAKKQCAEAVLGKGSVTKLSQWYSVVGNCKTERVPLLSDIERLALYMKRDLESLVDAAIGAEDTEKLYDNCQTAINQYKIRNNKGSSRTHDSTPEHIENLNAFTGAGYRIYLRLVDSEKNEVTSHFKVTYVNEPDNSGYTVLHMTLFRKEMIYDYSGTLIAPPQLGWALIFIEYKEKVLFRDRGVIILNFPEKSINQNASLRVAYGVMISVKLDNPKELQIQRVVAIRNDVPVSDDALRIIEEKLKEPIRAGHIISVTDIDRIHSEIYGKLLFEKDTGEES